MNSNHVTHALAPLTLAIALAAGGCGRDTRVNSNPGPGKPSLAEGGDAANRPSPNDAPPAASATVGTDSTGRPSDASGGTTGAGSGSKTSGTQNDEVRREKD